jgi:hypothetical protein
MATRITTDAGAVRLDPTILAEFEREIDDPEPAETWEDGDDEADGED